MRVISRGSKIGIHCIQPNQTMPFVRRVKELGFSFPVVKGVDNAGLAIDVKRESPETITITRFVNDKWDSAQDVVNWSLETIVQAARESIQIIFDRTNLEERQAANYFEIVNEADPPQAEGWKDFGIFLCELVREANRRGIKLCLPAFNAGTPEWDEMNALASTGLFKLMKDGGHILSIHEGSFSNSIMDGFGDIIPGAPQVQGAGSMCFRYRYLYHILKQRDEIVPCVVSEWYHGDINITVPTQEIVSRLAWYDNEIRKDYYVWGVLPFTADPSPGWVHQNYNPHYPAFIDYMNSTKTVANAVETVPTPIPLPLPTPKFKVGLHGRADGRMQAADFDTVRFAKIEAVKLLDTADPLDVDVLKSIKSDMFILVRLFEDFRNRIISPGDFVSWKIDKIRQFYNKGVRYFEIHNEPNLILEGLGTTWNNGFGFTNWFNTVYSLLKNVFPDVQFGFPGTSPGATIPGIRMDNKTFLDQCNSALQKADWIGVHSYFVNDNELTEEINGKTYSYYTIRYPVKALFITEFSNPFSLVDKRTKGNQYVRYYKEIQKVSQIGAAFSFVSSASADFLSETWRLENGEQTEITAIVGNRDMPVSVSLVGKRVQTISDLNCRSGPNVSFPRLTTFYNGDNFTVREQVGDWVRITFDGWVHKNYLRVI